MVDAQPDSLLAALDPDARCLAAAAQEAGVRPAATTLAPAGGRGKGNVWLQLRLGGETFHYRAGALLRAPSAPTDAPILGHPVNGPSIAILRDRAMTKAVLTAAGVPTPAGGVFDARTLTMARAFVRSLDRPVCIRPNSVRRGSPVFPAVSESLAVDEAIRFVRRSDPRVVVEESVGGERLRFFYVAPRVVAARRPAGDGKAGGGKAGGGKDGEDGAPHPSYAAIAEAACRALPGLAIAGVEMVASASAAPAAHGNHWVAEIDAAPGLTPFLPPAPHDLENVADAVIRLLGQG